ncbi:scavenger receptor class B member 1 [Culicoides brevitarsis]|uniref:scavenger receptor class B member 1 n=1 Tax=Culicoides brevitarsis TaxID=469753 RepID=UPI00307C70D4
MTTIENIKVDRRKKRFLKFGFCGMICLIIAFAIIHINPLQMVADDMLSIRNGSYAFNLFKKPPLDVFISVYVFNITNGERFLSGDDPKLAIAEVGPYVYREILTHRNLTFNPNGTLTYVPHREVVFLPEKSIGDPKDHIITALNIPMLGISTLAHDLSFFAELAVSTLVKTTSSDPLLTLTAHDFLWGYDDTLISLASTVVPSVIPFTKLGLLDRMFDDGVNVVTINLPERVKKLREVERLAEEAKQMNKSKATTTDRVLDEMFNALDNESNERMENQKEQKKEQEMYSPLIRDYSIDMWNGSPGLHHWGWTNDKSEALEKNTGCNTLRGNYDGTLFPRNISKNEVFKYYRKCFCRTLPIEFTHEGMMDGVEAYWFKLADHAFESRYDDPETACFCKKKQCMKKGLGNITPCYWNIPIAVSLPHFYNSDPSLIEGVDGLNPQEEKHGSIIALQPKLGIPMKVRSPIQINLVMGDAKFNSRIKNFRNTVFPLIWAEIRVDRLSDELILLLQMLFVYVPPIQAGFAYLLALTGVSLFAIACLSILCVPPKTTQENLYSINNNCSSFGPKRDIRYSAVRILPLIGREMEKYYEKDDDRLV